MRKNESPGPHPQSHGPQWEGGTAPLPYILERCAPGEIGEPPAAALSERENEVARGLRTPKRRQDWVAGRIAAKRAVLAYLAGRGVRLEAAQVEVLNTRDGAPYVRLPEGTTERAPSLSISHSAAGGVAALGQGPIGVDLEYAEARPAGFLSVMVHESEWGQGLDADALQQTRLWTVKEAVSKLLGVGLSVDLWDIRYVPEGEGRRLQLHGRAKERWAAMGSPEIRIDTFMTQTEVLTVAYSAGGNTDA